MSDDPVEQGSLNTAEPGGPHVESKGPSARPEAKPKRGTSSAGGRKKPPRGRNANRPARTRNAPKKGGVKTATDATPAKFPRHSVEKALRIPRAIIDQNAGRECSDRESATFLGVGYNGPYAVELSSALKYGLLERPRPRHVAITERARAALRPQNPGDEIAALRAAILDAPDISTVYKHYRGENIPDGKFFDNALVDKFGIPESKVAEFSDIFFSSLEAAQLIEQRGDKRRILDVTERSDRNEASQDALRRATKPLK